MAKVLLGQRQNPGKPELFGEDVLPLAWEALGVGLAAFGNDRIVRPIVGQVVPLPAGGTGAKLVDAASTGVTGWLVGEGVGMVDGNVGRKLRRGGVLLAVAKAISAIIPGFSISATLPAPSWIPQIGAPAAKSNGNGNGAATTAALAAQGYASSGL